MKYWMILGVATAGAFAASPLAAQTVPQTNEAQLRAALDDAKKARDDAALALRKANEAIARIEEALPIPPDARPKPVSATHYRKDETHREFLRPKDMPSCDAPGQGVSSIGGYMLATEDQKKESTTGAGALVPDSSPADPQYEVEEPGTNNGINAFVYHCLGLTKAIDYENITNLSVQLVGTKGNDRGEMAVTRTARSVQAVHHGASGAADRPVDLVAKYNRYTAGAFASAGSDGDVPLIDFTESSFASGVGVLLGFEWGRSRIMKGEDTRNKIHEGIAKARQDCLADKMIEDPLSDKAASSNARPRLSLDPLTACEGNKLVEWMAETPHANQYWSDIVAPIWGYKKEPEVFAGAEGRFTFQKASYRPVIDPATGAVISATLPDPVKIRPRPFSLKAYAGYNFEVGSEKNPTATLGFTGSLTYRREIDWVQGTDDQVVCTPRLAGAIFELCDDKQKLAAPYTARGFVAGAQFNVQFRRFWYLPAISLSPRVTYALDTDRWGLEVPVFMLTDDEGKLNSGFKFACRFEGRTREGLVLKKDCGLNLFLGTTFAIKNSP